MSERHPLASEGSWVELRDPSELRYGDKQRIMASIEDPKRVMGASIDMSTALMALLVVSWQLPSQLPVPSQDPTVIGMLSVADGNALEELIKPAQDLLFPGDPEPKTDEEQAAAQADPGSPTGPTVE